MNSAEICTRFPPDGSEKIEFGVGGASMFYGFARFGFESLADEQCQKVCKISSVPGPKY